MAISDTEIIGKKFGSLTVKSQGLNNKYNKKVFICDCDCGTKDYSVPKIRLTTGKTKSCGCGRHPISFIPEELVGKKIGKFNVLEYVGKNEKSVPLLKCKCDCGTIVDVNGYNLKEGQTTNCGCIRKQTLSEMLKSEEIPKGTEVGLLTVLYENGKHETQNYYVYKCKCKCGREVDVRATYLRRKLVTSCGQCTTSYNNALVESFLLKLPFEYIPEYKFDDLDGFKAFDFYIPELNLCIEYDGEQHYYPINGMGGEEGFKRRIENDEIKNKYCKDNGIELLRIPYWKRDEIENILVNRIKTICSKLNINIKR